MRQSSDAIQELAQCVLQPLRDEAEGALLVVRAGHAAADRGLAAGVVHACLADERLAPSSIEMHRAIATRHKRVEAQGRQVAPT